MNRRQFVLSGALGFTIISSGDGAIATTDLGKIRGDFYIPENFGAVGNASFLTATGQDDSAAFAKCLTIAAAYKGTVLLSSIYYIADASVLELANHHGLRIVGQGLDSGIVVAVNRRQSSLWIKSAVHISDFRIHCKPLETKPANSGHLQTCITVGDGFYLDRDQVEVRDWRVERMRLTRVSGVGGGYAFCGVGHVSNGYVGEIDDIGSGENHSGLVSFHWGARSATGKIGETVLRSWHPHHIQIGQLHSESSAISLSLSSCFAISQEGIITNIGGVNLFNWLPGDEANSVAAHDPALIGKAIKIQGPLLGRDLHDGNHAVVFLFSVGTSKASYMPDDRTVIRQVALNCEIEIGDVTIVGKSSASKPLVAAYKWYGVLNIGRITGSNRGGGEALEVSYSSGSITVKDLVGYFPKGAVRAVASLLTLSNTKVSALTRTKSSEYTERPSCKRFSATLSGVHAVGATKLNLSKRIAPKEFVMPGWVIRTGGSIVHATAYAPESATVIYVTPLQVALSDGESIVIDLC